MERSDRRGALVLLSHGALLCGAGEALCEHAERLRARGEYAAVEPGYLNYSKPPFAEAVERVAAVLGSCGRVVVVPYFLVPGKFVTADLPRQIEAARAAHPHLEFALAAPIGYHPELADALIELAAGARPRDLWREDLRRAAAFCESSPRCPLFQTALCRQTAEIARNDAGSSSDAADPLLVSPHPSTPSPKNRRGGAGVTVPTPNAEHRAPNTALLVLVHGSPHASANAPMFDVVERVRERGAYPVVEVGFLECNEPDIATAIERCVTRSVARIVAVPYFLHTGGHVAEDLPAALEAAQARHPDIEFLLADFLGRAPQVTDILAERAAALLEP